MRDKSQQSLDPTPRWGRWEGQLFADGDAPPTTRVVVEFISPSGIARHIAAFWDGLNNWRVRIMPDEEGSWRYRTLSNAKNAGLESFQGSFDCVVGRSNNCFEKHGPVALSADRRHFAHGDGTPFFFLSDTAWNGPLLSTPDDWENYLDDRAAKKFTAIQFVTHAPWVGSYSTAEGDVSYTGLAHCPVNPHAFARIDQRIAAINARGMLAVPVLVWAAPFGDARIYNPGQSLPEAQIIQLAQYQVARFGAHHVCWILNGDGRYEKEAAATWRRVGRAVFGDIPHAPVAIHPMGTHWPYDEFRGETWLDVIGYQSSHSADERTLHWLNSGPASKEWKLEPPRPVVNLEPCYEDILAFRSKELFGAYRVRQAVYFSLLNAPTAGVTYGAQGVWGWDSSAREPLNHAGTGIAKPWTLAKDLPGSFDMMRVAELFTSLPWWDLRPDRELLADQPGTRDANAFVAAARTADRRCMVLYLPVGGSIQLASAPASDARLEWFDPRTGVRTVATGQKRFHAPDDRDWVLVIT